jgi:hypothetical protein
MVARNTLFSLIFFFILCILSEVLLRVGLVCYGYPFFRPSDYVIKQYYHDVEAVAKKNIKRGDDVKDVLILGGSVVSSGWSGMEIRLDTILKKTYNNGEKIAFYNVAFPGHTSLDNRIKYDLLENQQFDLVIYYEAINENRANNIPENLFYKDYSHIKWYDEINTLRSHSEINYTVIPYVFHLVVKSVVDRLRKRKYVSYDGVDPDYYQYGGNIKTASSYSDNVLSIARLARKKGDKLLLVKYATYFPENVKLQGGEEDKKYFTPCYAVSSITTWGTPENVKKGIEVHNQILEKIASTEKTYFFDMKTNLPADSTMFCDVCHLSEPGARYFAKELSKCIVDNKLLD